MRSMRNLWLAGSLLVLTGVLALAGCYNTPIETSDFAQGPAPRRMQSPARQADDGTSYEDSLTGGQVFTMYCSYCHNAPYLSEKPYSQFRNIAAHMRVRANLTGKEYAKLMEFLRRWNDIPPPNPTPEGSPKRFIPGQPIPELREQQPRTAPALPAGPRPGAADLGEPRTTGGGGSQAAAAVAASLSTGGHADPSGV